MNRWNQQHLRHDREGLPAANAVTFNTVDLAKFVKVSITLCSLASKRRNPREIQGLRVLDTFPQDVVQVSLVFDLLRVLL